MTTKYERERNRAELEKRRRFERETWDLELSQRRAAATMQRDLVEILETAARFGGLEVGELGAELARLAAIGFIEIGDGSNGHRLAKVTRDGLAAMLLWRDQPRG